MARGALRGAATAWLGLIALQVATTRGGSGRVSEAFSWADSLLQRALSPTVPAIPDLASGEAWGVTGTTAAAATPAPEPSPLATYTPFNRVPIPTF